MPDLFLSYCRDDRLVMHVLRDNLRSLGFNVWIDEEHLTVGTPEWQHAIEEAIKHAGAMVVLLSPGAKASHWVNNEILYAQARRKRIFPVLLAGDNLTAIPLSLLSAHYADMRGRASYEDEFRKLVKGLADHFGMTVAAFHLDFSGARIQVHVYGNVEGGKVLVAGRDVVEQTVVSPHVPPPPKPEPPARQRETRKPFEPEMVLIPAGPFLMGSPKSDRLRFGDEPEQFELDLDYDYAIGKYPVTVGQYRVFVDAGGYGNRSYWTDAGWTQRKSDGRTQPRYWDELPWIDSDNLPVVGISWYEAYAYTRWLAEATGRNYRLPTEAEWEKAARGGLQIPDGHGGMEKNPNPARIWPWGDEEPTKELCNFKRNVGQTSPVTSHAAQAECQPYGLYDMAGNVWEWCLSKWAAPFTHPEDNDPQGNSPRVVRGGSWGDVTYGVRAAYRDGFNPDDSWDNDGFRCALSY